MPRPVDFPSYGPCEAKKKLDDLVRLLQEDIFDTQYMDARSAARLVATALKCFKDAADSESWSRSEVLRGIPPDDRLNITCAALFDLVCNVEYLHGRMTNAKWIYCHRDREDQAAPVVSYFSFLKQCPKCCQDIGLGKRLSGAQHKPSSHHIGEITTTAMVLFLALVGHSSSPPLKVGVISKQSHDVDAVAWRNDLLVLFEMKASPLVTFPVRATLGRPYTKGTPDGPVEATQHALIDVDFHHYSLDLYLANRDSVIPLGTPSSADWPYRPVTEHVATEAGLIQYLEAWFEVFEGYKVPKTRRTGRQVVMGYLANGWGDDIDSNKTKAGLGRTDDIKKGTYQLLKYGAYYRAGCPHFPVRGSLVANLDPVFMYRDYMSKLIDARWAPASSFETVPESPEYLKVLEDDLYFIYDAVFAFNRPVVNDQLLGAAFDLSALRHALEAGRLDSLLDQWMAD